MSNTVRNNESANRFELDVDGHVAFAEYKLAPGVITFTHTVVPKELGGRGVGSMLARGALDQVRASGLKVVAQCPFIAAFIKKNDEYADLLA
ncbi:GNAT family N-acetyltransferase [Terrarubrum flagellatum]|uniref:GNAT family N-acetyltransferase n=1 Tax=Terrirubrum flagellatum TaxID=2895980 RepID=UPI0031454599